MPTLPLPAPTRSLAQQVLLALVLVAVPVVGFSAVQVLTAPKAASAGLGDTSAFVTIVTDVQALTHAGDLAAAKRRVTDFESAWDSAETSLRAKNPTVWTAVDDAADAALHAVRSAKPSAEEIDSSLTALLATLASANQ